MDQIHLQLKELDLILNLCSQLGFVSEKDITQVKKIYPPANECRKTPFIKLKPLNVLIQNKKLSLEILKLLVTIVKESPIKGTTLSFQSPKTSIPSSTVSLDELSDADKYDALLSAILINNGVASPTEINKYLEERKFAKESVSLSDILLSNNRITTSHFVKLDKEIKSLTSDDIKSILDPYSLSISNGILSIHKSSLAKNIDRYQILGEIARGGMGVVYAGYDPVSQRKVAIKTLRGGVVLDGESKERFLREAKVVSSLNHPGIVTVYDVGEHEGLYYFTMEYIDGMPISEYVKIVSPELPVILDLVVQAATALSYSHSHRVIHRDIKPGNILVDTKARVKITDFGLSKQLVSHSNLSASENITVSGIALGTPAYMAPEQARGNMKDVDERSDIYSLGAVFYEILVGRPPFAGSTSLEICRSVITDDPIPARRLNPSIPKEVDTICSKAMEKYPSRRYQDVLEMADDIKRFLSGEPILAKPPSLFYWVRKKLNKYNIIVAMLSVFLPVMAWLLMLFIYYIPWKNVYDNEKEKLAKTDLLWEKRHKLEDYCRNVFQKAEKAYNRAHQAYLEIIQSGEQSKDIFKKAGDEAYNEYEKEWQNILQEYDQYQKEMDGAPSIFRNFLDIPLTQGHYFLANLHYLRNEDELWLQELSKVYRLSPLSGLGTEAMLAIGLDYFQNKKSFEKARAAFDRVIMRRPASFIYCKALRYYAELLFKSGEVERALAIYKYLLNKNDLPQELCEDTARLFRWSSFFSYKGLEPSFPVLHIRDIKLYDIDCDGVHELVILKGSDTLEIDIYKMAEGRLKCFISQKLESIVPRDSNIITAGDLDGDKEKEIIIGVGSPMHQVVEVYIFSIEQNKLVLKWRDASLGNPRGGLIKDIVVADVNNDGINDLVVATTWYAWNSGVYENLGNFKFKYQQFTMDFPNTDVEHIAVADFDKDGILEILLCCTTNNHHLTIIKHIQNLGYKIITKKLVGTPVRAEFIDIDNDGFLEILLAKSNRNPQIMPSIDQRLRERGIYILRFKNGRWDVLGQYKDRGAPQANLSCGLLPEIFMDLDGDQKKEVIFLQNIVGPLGSDCVADIIRITPDGKFERLFEGLGKDLMFVADLDNDKTPEFYYSHALSRRFEVRSVSSEKKKTDISDIIGSENEKDKDSEYSETKEILVAKDMFDMGLIEQGINVLSNFLDQRPGQDERLKSYFLLVEGYLRGGATDKALDMCERIAKDSSVPKDILNSNILKYRIYLTQWELDKAYILLKKLKDSPLLEFQYTPGYFEEQDINTYYSWLSDYSRRQDRLEFYPLSEKGIPNTAPYRFIHRGEEVGIITNFESDRSGGIPFYYDGRPFQWTGEFRIERIMPMCNLYFGILRDFKTSSDSNDTIKIEFNSNVNFQKGPIYWYIFFKVPHIGEICSLQQPKAFPQNRWLRFSFQIVPDINKVQCSVSDAQTGGIIGSNSTPLVNFQTGRYYLGPGPLNRDYRPGTETIVWFRSLRLLSGSPYFTIHPMGNTPEELTFVGNGYLSVRNLDKAVEYYSKALQNASFSDRCYTLLYRGCAYLLMASDKPENKAKYTRLFQNDLEEALFSNDSEKVIIRAVNDAPYQPAPVIETLAEIWAGKNIAEKDISSLESIFTSKLKVTGKEQPLAYFHAASVLYKLECLGLDTKKLEDYKLNLYQSMWMIDKIVEILKKKGQDGLFAMLQLYIMNDPMKALLTINQYMQEKELLKPEMLFFKGLALRSLGEYFAAIEAFNQGLKHNPNLSQAQIEISYCQGILKLLKGE